MSNQRNTAFKEPPSRPSPVPPDGEVPGSESHEANEAPSSPEKPGAQDTESPAVKSETVESDGSAQVGGNQKQGSGQTLNVKLSEFQERETKVIDKYAEAIGEYRKVGRWYLGWHRLIGIILLICAVIAPVLIVSNKDLFGIDDQIWITRAATGVSVMVALLEGLRRIFKNDERARAAFLAMRDLVLAREKYRLQRLRYPDLTPERMAAFEAFWQTYFMDVYAREVAGWAASFKDDAPEGEPGKTPPAPKSGTEPGRTS